MAGRGSVTVAAKPGWQHLLSVTTHVPLPPAPLPLQPLPIFLHTTCAHGGLRTGPELRGVLAVWWQPPSRCCRLLRVLSSSTAVTHRSPAAGWRRILTV